MWRVIPFTTTFFLAISLSAQLPAPARFEVVSIRIVPPDTPSALRDRDFTPVLPGGQFIDSRTRLSSMIAFAYSVKNYRQLAGLPGFAESQSYAVAARAAQDAAALPPAENVEQVRMMMRAMLEDRFHLQIHRENRDEPILNLEVARGGFKFRAVEAPVPPAKGNPVGGAVGDDGGRMVGSKSTVASLAGVLALFLKRPVIDRTELNGYYDFDVKWSAPAVDGQPAGPGLSTEGEALLISILQGQFGLKLTSARGPVEYWVVDHVEPPTGN